MSVVQDHRAPWKGPEPTHVPPEPIELKKVSETKEHVAAHESWEAEAKELLLKYMAMHGDWREVIYHRPQGSIQAWDFTRCECVTCQAAEKLVGHPSTPNG